MRRLSALIVATLFLAVSAAAAACPHDKGEKGKKWTFKEKLAHKLRTHVGLDEELAKKVEAVFEAHAKEFVEAKKEKKAALKELKDLLKADSNDDGAYAKGLARLQAAEKALEAVHEKEFAEAAKLLNAKQQVKLSMALYRLQHGKKGGWKKHKDCDGKGSCGCGKKDCDGKGSCGCGKKDCDGKGSCGCGDKECTGKPDCPCGKPDCKCKEGK